MAVANLDKMTNNSCRLILQCSENRQGFKFGNIGGKFGSIKYKSNR